MIGVVYDTVGRRKPLLISVTIASIAFIVYPFIKHSILLYYVVNFLIVPFTVTGETMPFIPDLIKEES